MRVVKQFWRENEWANLHVFCEVIDQLKQLTLSSESPRIKNVYSDEADNADSKGDDHDYEID